MIAESASPEPWSVRGSMTTSRPATGLPAGSVTLTSIRAKPNPSSLTTGGSNVTLTVSDPPSEKSTPLVLRSSRTGCTAGLAGFPTTLTR